MTEEQKKYYNAMKKLGSKKPQKPIPRPAVGWVHPPGAEHAGNTSSHQLSQREQEGSREDHLPHCYSSDRNRPRAGASEGVDIRPPPLGLLFSPGPAGKGNHGVSFAGIWFFFLVRLPAPLWKGAGLKESSAFNPQKGPRSSQNILSCDLGFVALHK